MAVASMIGAIGGTAIRQKAALDEHKETQRQMALRIAELERDSKTAYAVSQREGADEIRKAKILSSRARALAAFSGAGADDNTVLNVIADINGEGEYRRSIALYKGTLESRKLHDAAEETKRAKEAEKSAYKYKQMGIIMQLGESIGNQYSGSRGGGRSSGGGAGGGSSSGASQSGGSTYTGWV